MADAVDDHGFALEYDEDAGQRAGERRGDGEEAGGKCETHAITARRRGETASDIATTAACTRTMVGPVGMAK